MAKAKVELRGAASFTRANGAVFQRNKPQIISDKSAIRYYQMSPKFDVTILEEDPPPPPPPPEKEPELLVEDEFSDEEQALI